jgi:hypothetical protein
VPRPKTKLNSWDRTVYTQGDCWLLAWEIHQQRPDLFITASCCFDCWSHVAVTDGTYVLDINGWTPISEWLVKWDGDPDMELCTGSARSMEDLTELLCFSYPVESSFMQTEERRLVITSIVLAIPHPEVTRQLTDMH